MAASLREVVCVLDSQHLIDSESYQRRYHCRRHLEPGCYVVMWPDSAERLDFDETAEFRGPYSSRRIAEVAARGADPAPQHTHAR